LSGYLIGPKNRWVVVSPSGVNLFQCVKDFGILFLERRDLGGLLGSYCSRHVYFLQFVGPDITAVDLFQPFLSPHADEDMEEEHDPKQSGDAKPHARPDLEMGQGTLLPSDDFREALHFAGVLHRFAH